MIEIFCHPNIKWPSETSIYLFLLMNPISDLMVGWTLMVLAMMLPKLILPILYIFDRSLKRRRLTSIALFIFGYTFIWIVVGFIFNALILLVNLFMPLSYIPAGVLGIIAIVWHVSPTKQKFLNLGHEHKSLAAFGWAANRDAIVFGIMHGIWCVGSGWALMLLPMLLQEGHNLVMLIVTFIMISEHLEHPRVPKWYFSLRLRLLWIVIAQLKIKIKQVLELKWFNTLNTKAMSRNY